MIKYARSGDVHIGYRTDGDGPRDILYMSSLFVSIDAIDEEPHVARFARRLAALGRLVQFDPRGIGLSDRGDGPMTEEQGIADALAVLDAAGSESVAMVSVGGATRFAIELATRYPARIDALVLINCYARLTVDDGYPFGLPAELVTRFVEDNPNPDVEWSVGGQDDFAFITPSLRNDPRHQEWLQRASHRAASPATAAHLLRMASFADVRELLRAVAAPTLVISRRGDRFVPPPLHRYVAEHIQGAQFVEVPGVDHMPYSGDADDVADEIEEFLTGQRHGSADRVLTTVLVTDIVDSTVAAATLGDAAWRAQLDMHDSIVRAQLGRHGGREVNTTGDGFVAAFESPTQAVKCAQAIVATDLPVRIGIHTGECERRGEDLAGLAVHIAARVAAQAGSGEVLVSRTVCDLVGGSGMQFSSRGLHALKGVETEWELFAAT